MLAPASGADSGRQFRPRCRARPGRLRTGRLCARRLAASVDRSSGFMFERGFAAAGVSSRTSFGDRAAACWLRICGRILVPMDFTAMRLRTNGRTRRCLRQTTAWDAGRGGKSAPISRIGRMATIFSSTFARPGVAENRHRTHAALGARPRVARHWQPRLCSPRVSRRAPTGFDRATLATTRRSGRVRLASGGYAVNANTQVDASLRVDRYTEFGTAWSPALGVGWWPVPTVRLRASTGRAFRVPTFTERFYSDPANWARPEVGPEAAWAGEGGRRPDSFGELDGQRHRLRPTRP